MELYYRRSEINHKGRLIPARIETVVIFLPDVRSCTPTRLEWDSLHIKYKNSLDCILNKNTKQSIELNNKTSSLSTNVVVAKDADSIDVTVAVEPAAADAANDFIEPSVIDSVSNKTDSNSSALISTGNSVVAVNDGDAEVVADNISAEITAVNDETSVLDGQLPNVKAEPVEENNKAVHIIFLFTIFLNSHFIIII